jgi:hypothetical protein
MTKRELLIIFDTLSWATDQIDDIIGQGPDDEKYWKKIMRRAQKSFDIVAKEIQKRNRKRNQ